MDKVKDGDMLLLGEADNNVNSKGDNALRSHIPPTIKNIPHPPFKNTVHHILRHPRLRFPVLVLILFIMYHLFYYLIFSLSLPKLAQTTGLQVAPGAAWTPVC
jgi:hypothetical protein